MNRCRRCVIPDTRPDTPFVDGVCSACLSYANRPNIDWEARKAQLLALLDRHDGRCIVPSSGGKDSTYQVLKLLELGAKPLVVTATTCHLTTMGRANIDNLARYATTIEVTPNRSVRAKLNRIGLEQVGDISWPEHVSIFTVPFRVAAALGYTLLFYGENPQNQYGGPHGAEEAMQLTRRWRSEFGGFLGLRPDDLIGTDGITERDMEDYLMPSETQIGGVEAHFLGQYIPWDSHENARVAIESGMAYALPSKANWWPWENLDNAQTGLHDYGGFLKYGYGRAAAQVSVDIRKGLLSRESGMAIVMDRDWRFPMVYGCVHYYEVADRIGMKPEAMVDAMRRFTNWDLFIKGEESPVLKDFAN